MIDRARALGVPGGGETLLPLRIATMARAVSDIRDVADKGRESRALADPILELFPAFMYSAMVVHSWPWLDPGGPNELGIPRLSRST